MSNKGRKILEFKESLYAFEELIDMYCDEVYDDKFQEGDVTNTETGDIFSIDKLLQVYISLNQDLIGQMSHLNSSQKSRIKDSINRKTKKLRIKELNKKLDDDTINKKELEELFILEDNKDIKKELQDRKSIKQDIIVKDFIKVNQQYKIPREINLTNVGRFYRLLEIVVNKNGIHNTNHGNSNEMKLKDVMEYIECSKSTFKRFMKEMEDYSIIRRFKPDAKRWVIFINPIYAHRNLEISSELYNVFKDVLEEKLDKKVIKYMEFVFSNSNSVGSLSISEE